MERDSRRCPAPGRQIGYGTPGSSDVSRDEGEAKLIRNRNCGPYLPKWEESKALHLSALICAAICLANPFTGVGRWVCASQNIFRSPAYVDIGSRFALTVPTLKRHATHNFVTARNRNDACDVRRTH